MKKNAFKELITKSVQELSSMVQSMHTEIAKLTVDKNTGKEKNTEAVGNKRRDLAQILTIKRLKELTKS